jgi:hypothetical protein
MFVFSKAMLTFLEEIMAKMVFQFHFSIVETFYIPIHLKSTSSIHKGAIGGKKKCQKSKKMCMSVKKGV